MKNILVTLTLTAFLAGAAHAAELRFEYEHNGADSIDYFYFNVDSGNASIVNIYSESPAPYNPYLSLWKPSGSDWSLVASNDDTATLDFNETVNALDAQLKPVLTGGAYLLTFTESGLTPAGTLLSQGFAGAGDFDFIPYAINVSGNVSAVPVPAAVWLFGAGLAALGGLRQKKNTC